MNIHNILVLSRFHKFWDRLDFSHRSIRKEHTMDTGHPNLDTSGGLKAPPLSHQLWILRCWLLGFPMASFCFYLPLSVEISVPWYHWIRHWIHSPSQATKYVRSTVVIRSASPCFSFNPRLGCPTTSADVPRSFGEKFNPHTNVQVPNVHFLNPFLWIRDLLTWGVYPLVI